MIAAAAVVALPSAPAVAIGACEVDFDGDGDCDLAVGAPFEGVDGFSDAGSVSVLYGSGTTLGVAGDQNLHQNTSGAGFGEADELIDPAEANDRYGSALGAGDFNFDGNTDLAVGVPAEDIGGVTNTGMVDVLYGSDADPVGLDVTTNQLIDQADLGGTNNGSDWFGNALAVGDFNDDTFADLAIGAYLDNTGTTNAGVVYVVYGSLAGLDTSTGEIWGQNTTGIADTAESGDQFGQSLAAGDFDDDGIADLAIGVPLENVTPTGGSSQTDAGAINVILGSGTGLTEVGDSFFSQGDELSGAAEAGDNFAFSLAAGDFDGDGDTDLAAGAPLEDTAVSNAGGVNVLVNDSGLAALTDELWTQDDTDGDPDVPNEQAGDRFGWALASGDFDGSGVGGTDESLAVGVYGENVVVGATSFTDAGAVAVLVGAAETSLTSSTFLTQEGLADSVESSDQFGKALGVGDFGTDGFIDLVIGVPLENIGSISDGGGINVVYGSATGLDGGSADEFWSQDTGGVRGGAESGDQWGGQALAG